MAGVGPRSAPRKGGGPVFPDFGSGRERVCVCDSGEGRRWVIFKLFYSLPMVLPYIYIYATDAETRIIIPANPSFDSRNL